MQTGERRNRESDGNMTLLYKVRLTWNVVHSGSGERKIADSEGIFFLGVIVTISRKRRLELGKAPAYQT